MLPFGKKNELFTGKKNAGQKAAYQKNLKENRPLVLTICFADQRVRTSRLIFF